RTALPTTNTPNITIAPTSSNLLPESVVNALVEVTSHGHITLKRKPDQVDNSEHTKHPWLDNQPLPSPAKPKKGRGQPKTSAAPATPNLGTQGPLLSDNISAASKSGRGRPRTSAVTPLHNGTQPPIKPIPLPAGSRASTRMLSSVVASIKMDTEIWDWSHFARIRIFKVIDLTSAVNGRHM
ncbi:hypothetical protein CVT25_015917, partial [Psilocybe cyanescens]